MKKAQLGFSFKSSHEFTYKPKMSLTLYISFESFDACNDLYKFKK